MLSTMTVCAALLGSRSIRMETFGPREAAVKMSENRINSGATRDRGIFIFDFWFDCIGSALAFQFFLNLADQSQAEDLLRWNILFDFERSFDVKFEHVLDSLRRWQARNPVGKSLGKAANALHNHGAAHVSHGDLFERDVG